MVLVNDIKYSCETCIKGHRSSSCKHTDRPLFEIKKKGRPITQCEKCREARKTKQLHTKCLCSGEPKELSLVIKDKGPPIRKKVTVPDHAAFPNGLPASLLPPMSYGTDSTSDFARGLGIMCMCPPGSDCQCHVPKKRRARKKKAVANSEEIAPSAPDSAYILARIAELRPVLPREGRVHHPSLGTTNDAHQHHVHGFSPYDRAYDHTLHNNSQQQPTFDNGWYPPPPSSSDSTPSLPFPSPCNCGTTCACPGCPEHALTVESAHAYSTCANPNTCASCLDCTVMPVPAHIFPAEPPAADTMQSIDDWLRQISQPPTGQTSLPSVTTWLSLPTVPTAAVLSHAEWLPPVWQDNLQLPPITSQGPETPPPSPVHRARSHHACICRPPCLCRASDCEDSSSDHGATESRRSVSDGHRQSAPELLRETRTSFPIDIPPLPSTRSESSSSLSCSPSDSEGLYVYRPEAYHVPSSERQGRYPSVKEVDHQEYHEYPVPLFHQQGFTDPGEYWSTVRAQAVERKIDHIDYGTAHYSDS